MLSSFTFTKRLFSSSSHSAIRVVSSAYLKSLIFLPAILIPACASSSPAFLMIYSAYKLNKQMTIYQYTALTYSFPDLEPVCFSMSSSNCCFLICIQISQEAGQVVWYVHLFKNFPQFVVIHTVKWFGIVPKKGSAKECSNYCTVALISHTSKVMFKILQARLQQYVNQELPGIKVGFRKGRGTRDLIANIHWIIEET